MEPISLGQVAEGLIISVAIALAAVVFIQTALEDHRILLVLLTAPFAAYVFTTPGTNGSMLVRSLFALGVLFLVAAAVFRNITRPRIWGPLVGTATGFVSLAAFYGE